MPKQKMYRRPDGLYEKKLVIGGKRVAFRAKTERGVMQKIAAYQQKEETGRVRKAKGGSGGPKGWFL